jgi:hypothetical protein
MKTGSTNYAYFSALCQHTKYMDTNFYEQALVLVLLHLNSLHSHHVNITNCKELKSIQAGVGVAQSV